MMINERSRLLLVHSFGNSVGESSIFLCQPYVHHVSIECSLSLFCRGLPQAISFDLWLKRSFDIVNYKMVYMILSCTLYQLYYSWSWLIDSLTTAYNHTMAGTFFIRCTKYDSLIFEILCPICLCTFKFYVMTPMFDISHSL